jgi:hypothetical protein
VQPGLAYPSASPDFDDRSPLDLLLDEFSVLDGNSHVDRFNVLEIPYVQDIGAIDRLMAETSNTLCTGGFVFDNTEEQIYRPRPGSL